MDIIKKTKRMMRDGLATITNSEHLISELSDKTVNELKKMRQENGQLTPAAQHEMSLRGDRLALIEFHRFIFNLSDSDIKRIWNAKKQFWIDNKLGEDENTYCNVNLLIDVTQYHLCLRDDRGFDQMICDQIARSFRQNMKLARNYEEITSAHMINFAKNLLKDYAKKAADFQKAREMLGLTQAALSEKLGWTTVKQISNIETGARTVQKQTELAIECLLRREKKWTTYLKLNY